MKKFFMSILMASFLLVSCGEKKSKEETIKIGAMGPLTGSLAMYGISATNGAKLAIDEINAAGGILGKKVEFNLIDESGDPIQAVNAYNKLVEWGMDALVGDITSKPTIAVAERAVLDKMPMITPTGTQLNITEAGPNVFRLCFTDPYQGEVLAYFMKNDLKKQTAAVLVNTSSDYSNGIATSFIETANKLGIKIVAFEGYSDNDKDFKVQLTKMIPQNPDVILIPEYYEKSSLMAIQAKELGLNAILLGGDGWDGIIQATDSSSYKAIENSYFANHYSDQDESEKVVNFLAAYETKFKEHATAFSALSYDSVYLIKEAMEKATTTDKEKVTEEIKKINFSGVTGDLVFDSNNNPVKSVTISKIVDGNYKVHSVVSTK